MGKRGYYDGTNSLEGKEFIDEFLSSENMDAKESHDVVLVLMKTDEIDVIVDEIIMGDQKRLNPTITLNDRVSFWWIKARDQIEVDLDLATELLGRDYNVYDFLVNVSSTVGRAYTLGNRFVITADLVGLEREIDDEPNRTT